MQRVTDYMPTDDDVKHIFSDTYKFFLRFKDVDIMDCSDEVVKAYREIEDNYNNCDFVKNVISSVMEVLKKRSSKYQILVNNT